MKTIKEIRKLCGGITVETALDDIHKVTGKRLTKSDFAESYMPIHDRLFKQWYDSFDPTADPRTQEYDYSVYADPEYVFVIVDCFRGWTRTNVFNTIKYFLDIGHQPSSILDIFAGTGQSTVMMATAFPDSVVRYYNSDPTQVKLFDTLRERLGVKNVEIVDNPAAGAECVTAYEAVEHLLRPIDYMRPILSDPRTNFYVDASSFSIDSIGHFRNYVVEEEGETEIIFHKSFKRRYTKWLRSINFQVCSAKGLVDHQFGHENFFNRRPQPFVRA